MGDFILLDQRSSTSLAPGISFLEDSVSTDGWCGGWFGDDSRALHRLCDLFLLLLLHQFHLRSSGIKSQRLVTPVLDDSILSSFVVHLGEFISHIVKYVLAL